MPQPGEAFEPQPAAEDYFFDLLAEVLQGLDESARGQFLRQYFRTTAQIDFTEAQSNECWVRILQRRRELTESLGKRVSLKTAILDVLASANYLHVPILMEYEEFKKLQINAATDALTGLYNRRLFDESCDKELNRAKRYGQPLAVVVMDLHKLKEVNDRHGHLQGDKVLHSLPPRSAILCAPPISLFASEATSSPCFCPRPTPSRPPLSVTVSARNSKATFASSISMSGPPWISASPSIPRMATKRAS